jgi:PIN domain nuclease of toxin-antitoxin system
MIRLLLDTHVILWWAAGDVRLSQKARDLVESDGNKLYLSSVTAIEIAIKAASGKLESALTPTELIEWVIAHAGLVECPIRVEHGLMLESMPVHHRDPFDRLLVAQAKVEGLTLLSGDAKLRQYDVDLIW